MEKWKTKSRFPTFPPPRRYIEKGSKQEAAGPRGFAPPTGRKPKKGNHPQRAVIRAHLVLEWKPSFRLISRWNQILISGSFLDWKML
jgi:hypothetical protein